MKLSPFIAVHVYRFYAAKVIIISIRSAIWRDFVRRFGGNKIAANAGLAHGQIPTKSGYKSHTNKKKVIIHEQTKQGCHAMAPLRLVSCRHLPSLCGRQAPPSSLSFAGIGERPIVPTAFSHNRGCLSTLSQSNRGT